MRFLLFVTLLCMVHPMSAAAAGESNAYSFEMKNIDGKATKLSDYKGKVALFLNVASKCGFTPQYKGLEALYRKYKDKGFVILGFPANDFLWQEPADEKEIKEFCSLKYDVTFPMFSKIHVKGDEKAPLYNYLTEASGEDVSWNFNKYLVDKNGKVIKHFGSKVTPESPELIQAIEQALAQP